MIITIPLFSYPGLVLFVLASPRHVHHFEVPLHDWCCHLLQWQYHALQYCCQKEGVSNCSILYALTHCSSRFGFLPSCDIIREIKFTKKRTCIRKFIGLVVTVITVSSYNIAWGLLFIHV